MNVYTWRGVEKGNVTLRHDGPRWKDNTPRWKDGPRWKDARELTFAERRNGEYGRCLDPSITGELLLRALKEEA